MFYELQPELCKNNYKQMLTIVGNLTLLFSNSDCPYLPYRCHENIFCKYLEADNLARADCSADAKQGTIGIGLKTWVGQDDQKVAEFGKLRETYKNLKGLDLVKTISQYRNERIRITKNIYQIDKMIYHIVKRIPRKMQILEHAFEEIDIENISILQNRGNKNNTYFTDGKHIYHFSTSKNTLYMLFEEMELLDQFEVNILPDPYTFLMAIQKQQPSYIKSVHNIATFSPIIKDFNPQKQLCLRLYSTKADGTKFVAEKSGLNLWNAKGRPRHPDEVYIPYPSIDRQRHPDFFPPRDVVFSLRFPDGHIIPSKVCQDDSKAIMSNPNRTLGNWLLRNVFELPEGTLITYRMLEIFGIDSVIFTKHTELDYSIDFAELGTYEAIYEE